jgi:hypothetical protein
VHFDGYGALHYHRDALKNWGAVTRLGDDHKALTRYFGYRRGRQPAQEDLLLMTQTPDFAKLFPRPDDDEIERLEPRTALMLWESLLTLGVDLKFDLGRFDLQLDPFESSVRLTNLPWFTWKQDKAWVREFVQAAWDLNTDLSEGRIPYPRNTAEEVVLYWAIQDADGTLNDDQVMADYEPYLSLPEEIEPFDQSHLLQALYQDIDFLMLFEPDLDGFEQDRVMQKELGMVDFRAREWFKWFDNVEPRDPDRAYFGQPTA